MTVADTKAVAPKGSKVEMVMVGEVKYHLMTHSTQCYGKNIDIAKYGWLER